MPVLCFLHPNTTSLRCFKLLCVLRLRYRNIEACVYTQMAIASQHRVCHRCSKSIKWFLEALVLSLGSLIPQALVTDASNASELVPLLVLSWDYSMCKHDHVVVLVRVQFLACKSEAIWLWVRGYDWFLFLALFLSATANEQHARDFISVVNACEAMCCGCLSCGELA